MNSRLTIVWFITKSSNSGWNHLEFIVYTYTHILYILYICTYITSVPLVLNDASLWRGAPNLPGRSDDSGTNNHHYDVNVQHAGIAKIGNSPTILGISKVHRWDVE